MGREVARSPGRPARADGDADRPVPGAGRSRRRALRRRRRRRAGNRPSGVVECALGRLRHVEPHRRGRGGGDDPTRADPPRARTETPEGAIRPRGRDRPPATTARTASCSCGSATAIGMPDLGPDARRDVPDAGDVVSVVVSGPVAVYPSQGSGPRVTRGSGGRLLRAGSLISLVACCAALAGGCGGGSGQSSIVLYNGQHPQLTSALVAAFEKQTGITVQMRTNDSVVLADQILQEGDASPADVYLSENSPELMNLEQHGLLARLPQSILAPGPGRRRLADGQVGRRGAAGQQPRLRPVRSVPRSQLPASILDLAQPQWKGKVAIAPIDSDFPPIVGAVIATHGEAAARDVARRPEAERPDLPGRGGGRRGRQPRRRGDRGDQPVLLVPPPARARQEGDAQRALLLPARRRRLGRQRLRGGGARVEQAPEGRRAVRRASSSARPASRSSRRSDDFEYPARPASRRTLRFRRSHASRTPRSASSRSATTSMPPA